MCKTKVLFVAVSVLVTVSMVSADILFWEGGSGRWDGASNWRESSGWTVFHVPTASDDARIDSIHNPTVLIDSATTAIAGALNVGYQYNGFGKLDVTGGSLNVGSFTIAYGGGQTGVVNIGNGSVHSTGNMLVGNYGAGTLNMTGGDLQVDSWLSVAEAAGWGTGTINLDGGEIRAGNLNIKTGGLIDITDGVLKLWGDQRTAVTGFVNANLITASNPGESISNVYESGWTVVTAIPEPATIAILCSGGLLMLRRRK